MFRGQEAGVTASQVAYFVDTFFDHYLSLFVYRDATKLSERGGGVRRGTALVLASMRSVSTRPCLRTLLTSTSI